MAKIQFTSASVKDFKAFINLEHKSLSSCLRTLKENWGKSDLQRVARKDGLRFADLTPAYMVQWLEGSNYCKEGKLGRMVKNAETGEKEFKEWETWTPGRVLDYVRRASAAHFRAIMSK